MHTRKILFLLIIYLLNSGCRDYRKEHPGKTVFRYNEASGITSLDPAFAKDQANIWTCLHLYNGLVQLDNNLNIRPCIATHWDISDNGRTYTFHLRTDVYFHKNEIFNSGNHNIGLDNTRPVEANDFKFSFERLLDPLIAAPGAWVLNLVTKDLSGKTTGFTVINDSTFQIRLTKSFPPFLGLLAMPYCSVIPKEIAIQYGQDFRSHPCGTGPFHFSYWKEGVKLILLKNENYFEEDSVQKLPYLDAVEISFINDKQSAFIEFLKGNLDFLSGLDVSYKDELLTRTGQLQPRHQGHFNLATEPYLNTEYLGIFMDSTSELMKGSPLRMKLIRQALSFGFDKQKMMSYLRNNMGTPGFYGFIPPGLPSFNEHESSAYDFNPQRSRELLKAAGFPGGKGIPEIVLSTTSTYQDLCEFLKSQWENLGFKITIDVNQAAVHRKMVAEQKLQFFRGSWIADYPDAENYLSVFYSNNFAPAGPNYTHFRNKQFDVLYESAINELNDTIRYQEYREMDKIVMDEAPVIILYYDKVLRLTQNDVHGLGSNAMNLLFLKEVRKQEKLLR